MPGFNHTTENMKTKTLLGFFLLSVMAFCVSACQDDAEIILFSGSELLTKQELVQTQFLLQSCILTDGKRRISG